MESEARDEMLARLDAVITMGEVAQSSVTGGMYARPVADAAKFHGWKSRSRVLLEQLFGVSDRYVQEFVASVTDNRGRSDVRAGLGILQAVRDDVAAGYLDRFADLVAAGLFTDFLEMADHLASEGYKDPAASLAGAVLEDGLRRIATNAGIPVSKGDGIDSLNHKCATSGLYNALKRSEVDSWRILRNAADHGHFGEYESADVGRMITGVRGFLGQVLS